VHALYVKIIHIGCDWNMVRKMYFLAIVDSYLQNIVIEGEEKRLMEE